MDHERTAAAAVDVDPIFGPVIFSYSRAQALEDGVLADVSELAREAGFKYPTAITVAVHGELMNFREGTEQSYTGRLWDVLMVMRFTRADGDRVHFKVNMRQPDGRTRTVDLWALCGPGDTPEPVLTIMLEGED
jgi:hypothetical protein